MTNLQPAQNLYQKIREAAQSVRAKSQITPQMGLILGSGLGSVAQLLEDSITIPYQELPHFGTTSVEGHSGKLVLGRLAGVPCVLLQGRFHLYEGYTMEQVAFPTRVLCALGIHTLLLTNAAGGINTRFRPGQIMLIEDHLNLMGNNPLIGPNLTELGPRFPDMSTAYDLKCREVILRNAEKLGISLQRGVYGGLLGPTYETPAEVRMLRALGADAVGMSTVPETIAAVHLGVRVLGLSCITNMAAGISLNKLTHQEVVENSKLALKNLEDLIRTSTPELGRGERA